MNERILKLFMQACRHADYEHQNVPKELVEKFSELIVRECLEQVWYSREDGINGNVSEVIKDRIKQHFGVEE